MESMKTLGAATKNGDSPARPTVKSVGTFNSTSTATDEIGMTKREDMAKDFLAAILASGRRDLTDEEITGMAIRHADNLLLSLEKTK